MKITYYFSVILLFAGFARSGHAEITEDKIWKKTGGYVIPWRNMVPGKKAFALEGYKKQIDYAMANVGKSFKDIDSEQVNSKAYEVEVGYITYGLIAGQYCGYGDYKKCAEYHYKDYLQAIECSRKLQTIAPIPKECWGGTVGDHDLLAVVVDAYEMGGYYEEALPYYRMWLNNWVKDIKGNSFEEKLSILIEKAKTDDSLREGAEVINRWRKAVKLAKTAKPKTLDPAVQHHKWFYSDKQEEVLKALNYYYTHNVLFMLEKALKHKDPVIASKAKEYLDNLVKTKEAAGHETKK